MDKRVERVAGGEIVRRWHERDFDTERRDDQVGLGGVPPVDRRLGDASLGGDGFDREGPVADLDELLKGRGEDPAIGAGSRGRPRAGGVSTGSPLGSRPPA